MGSGVSGLEKGGSGAAAKEGNFAGPATAVGAMSNSDALNNLHHAWNIQSDDPYGANDVVQSVLSDMRAGDEIFAETKARSGNYYSISATKRPDGKFDIIEVNKGKRTSPSIHSLAMAADDILYLKTRSGGRSLIDSTIRRY